MNLKMNIYIGMLFGCLVGICAGAGSWDYKDQGRWAKDNENCGKKSQSPIDIKDAECDKALNNSITYDKYDDSGSSNFTMANSGYSLVLTTASTGATIKLGSLGTFELVQLHFHWGKNDKMGSEHLVNGKSYPAEMHLVHYNTKYGSINEALNKSDGLAVLGVFIEVGQENPTFKKFLNFTKYNVIYSGNSTEIDNFKMQDLLPASRDIFYRYDGSLTTPTCDESVTWTVFQQSISLSEDQLAEFRKLKDSKNSPLVDTYRVVQELNGRRITVVPTANDDCDSGAGSLGISIFTVLVSLLFFVSFH